MIEERKVDADIFSPFLTSHAPADVALQRRAANPAEAEKITFDVHKVFPDSSLSVIEAHETGDTVVIRWRLRAKWSTPLPFAPKVKPTGRPIDITGTQIYRFVGDTIAEKNGEIDLATFHEQACQGLSFESCQEMLMALARSPVARPE